MRNKVNNVKYYETEGVQETMNLSLWVWPISINNL